MNQLRKSDAWSETEANASAQRANMSPGSWRAWAPAHTKKRTPPPRQPRNATPQCGATGASERPTASPSPMQRTTTLSSGAQYTSPPSMWGHDSNELSEPTHSTFERCGVLTPHKPAFTQPPRAGSAPVKPIDLHATAAAPSVKPSLHTGAQAPDKNTSSRPTPSMLGAPPSDNKRNDPTSTYAERRGAIRDRHSP